MGIWTTARIIRGNPWGFSCDPRPYVLKNWQ
jgi:hypothetical protein